MPIDSSLYGQIRPPAFNTPFENLGQILQIRAQQENMRGLKEQREAIADQRRASADKSRLDAENTRREEAAAAQVRSLFARPNQPPTPEEISAVVGPDASTKIFTGFETLRKAQWANQAEARQDVASVLNAVLAFPTDDLRAKAYSGARHTLIQQGKLKPEDAPEDYSPDFVKNALTAALSPEKIAELSKPPQTVSPGQGVLNTATGKYDVPIPKEHEPTQSKKEWEEYKAAGGALGFNDYMTMDANRRRSVTTINTGVARDDANTIADAIISGLQPPVLTGLYRMAGPVRTALAKKGYNFTNAALDYQATQKHINALNSTQQTRLRQAVDVAYHSLDIIDSLSGQWKGGRFPLLNRASLASAKSGALGADAQKIATQLEAQITDLTSELGNVYMGGNSPTDHSLQLAAKNLNANWSNDVLQEMTKLARTNLQIRKNSMENVGVAGASVGNKYAPQTASPPANETPEHRVWRVGGKVGPEPK